MKKLSIVFIFILLLIPSATFAKPTPTKINDMVENDFILDEMLPNPNVYLYGIDSNGFPILLMNFSSTIPFYTIQDNSKFLSRLARHLPFFHTKTSSLKFFSLYLKLEESEVSNDGKGFYYKILKVRCKEVSQNIAYQDDNTFTAHLAPEYKEMKAGYIEEKFQRTTNYSAEHPIITYSGIGSDTLKIMLKKGRKYRIPAGHIDVAMLVMAVPKYNPSITYCSLHKYNYLFDFMNMMESDCSCNSMIRTLHFGKAYQDNHRNSYYEVNKKYNPNRLIVNSQVIMSGRINQIPSSSASVTNRGNVTFPICSKSKCKTNAGKTKKNDAQVSQSENQSDKSKLENQMVSDFTETQELKGPILKDSEFMYDDIVNDQILNVTPYKTPIYFKQGKSE